MADTSYDLSQAAIFFQDAANAVIKKAQEKNNKPDFQQVMDLLNLADELTDKSNRMFAMSVIKIGDEAKDSFASLHEAKQQIDDVISKVQKVQHVIDLAGKLVSTASAIITGDVQKIVSNVQDTLAEVSNLKSV